MKSLSCYPPTSSVLRSNVEDQWPLATVSINNLAAIGKTRLLQSPIPRELPLWGWSKGFLEDLTHKEVFIYLLEDPLSMNRPFLKDSGHKQSGHC